MLRKTRSDNGSAPPMTRDKPVENKIGLFSQAPHCRQAVRIIKKCGVAKQEIGELRIYSYDIGTNLRDAGEEIEKSNRTRIQITASAINQTFENKR